MKQVGEAALDAKRQQDEFDRQQAESDELEQGLAGRVAELEDARRSIAEMQSQLERERAEVASQRMELINRLGSAPPPIMPPPVEEPLETQVPSSDQEEPLDTSSRVGLFRKLRRDAKRRAIGAK